jgi:uncharacterized protein
MASNEKGESRGRGFAGMDRERQRQISSQGGKAAHQKGTAHEFDSEEAREAGRKGGMVSGGRRRARESGTPNPVTTEQETETENERESGESGESRSMSGGDGSNAPAGHGA